MIDRMTAKLTAALRHSTHCLRGVAATLIVHSRCVPVWSGTSLRLPPDANHLHNQICARPASSPCSKSISPCRTETSPSALPSASC